MGVMSHAVDSTGHLCAGVSGRSVPAHDEAFDGVFLFDGFELVHDAAGEVRTDGWRQFVVERLGDHEVVSFVVAGAGRVDAENERRAGAV
jgi:hypothetical protein